MVNSGGPFFFALPCPLLTREDRLPTVTTPVSRDHLDQDFQVVRVSGPSGERHDMCLLDYVEVRREGPTFPRRPRRASPGCLEPLSRPGREVGLRRLCRGCRPLTLGLGPTVLPTGAEVPGTVPAEGPVGPSLGLRGGLHPRQEGGWTHSEEVHLNSRVFYRGCPGPTGLEEGILISVRPYPPSLWGNTKESSWGCHVSALSRSGTPPRDRGKVTEGNSLLRNEIRDQNKKCPGPNRFLSWSSEHE